MKVAKWISVKPFYTGRKRERPKKLVDTDGKKRPVFPAATKKQHDAALPGYEPRSDYLAYFLTEFVLIPVKVKEQQMKGL